MDLFPCGRGNRDASYWVYVRNSEGSEGDPIPGLGERERCVLVNQGTPSDVYHVTTRHKELVSISTILTLLTSRRRG